ncbi:lysophospholipid acyltransferase family protein [Oceanobacter mangrovi]|uniref:lysophospholipid acyltransferase family protein n=1 Tax=Oceanobacter mangrovi TaxID=2862510 RepID=UPI001C8E28C3|nr:lysophospholipid acyltransferase family protein [Oceanobacter mangrovi]
MTWRVLATSFCFAMFGLGGAVIALLISPLLILLIRNPRQRQRLGKAVSSGAMYLFIQLMRAVGVMTYEVKNRHWLQQPGQLILANHPSLIDTIFLIAFARQADCVVKGKLLRNPFTWGPIRLAGYIANSSPEQVIAAAGESFRAGNNLIVFPEGTRTVAGESIQLKRGAANIAIKTATPIRPVVIRCEPPALTKEIKWYQVPERRVRMTLEVLPVIQIDQYARAENQAMAARQLTHELEQFFNKAVTGCDLQRQAKLSANADNHPHTVAESKAGS